MFCNWFKVYGIRTIFNTIICYFIRCLYRVTRFFMYFWPNFSKIVIKAITNRQWIINNFSVFICKYYVIIGWPDVRIYPNASGFWTKCGMSGKIGICPDFFRFGIFLYVVASLNKKCEFYFR